MKHFKRQNLFNFNQETNTTTLIKKQTLKKSTNPVGKIAEKAVCRGVFLTI